MSVAADRRSPNTFLIYGVSAAIIGAWWGALWALGIDVEGDGRALLVVVAVLVLAVAMVRDPAGMLCLVVFSLPFSLGILQIEVGEVTLNPFTIGITLAALVAIFAIAFQIVRVRFAADDILVVLLAGSFLLSTLLAADVMAAGFLAFHGVFIPVMTYFALRILVRTPDFYRKVIVSYVAGVTAFALYGLATFIENPQRLYVLNVPPISAAAMMTGALIVVGYSGWWRRKLGLVAGLVLLAGLAATFSRGYLLLLLLTPFVFGYIRRGGAGRLMTTMLAASLLGTLLFVQSYEMFYVEVENREQEQTAERMTQVEFWLSSLYGRAKYYAVGLEQFTHSPIVGNGFHENFVTEESRAVVWHNFHVEWLEYGGILAYLLYASVLITHFRSIARLARAHRAAAVNLTIVFTILVNGLTNSFTAGLSPVLGFLFLALNRSFAGFGPAQREEEGPAANAGSQGRRLITPTR